MADVSYSNPFSALPTTQQYNMSTPYGTYNTPLGMQAGNTQQNAAMPSLSMALQGQGMDLSKQQTDMQEYQGAEATEQRRQTRIADTRKSMYAAEKADSDSKLIPDLERNQRADLHQKYNEIVAKPEGQFVQALAHAYPALKDMPEAARGLVHKQMVDQWQRANPGKQLPPGLSNYGPDTMTVAKAGYQAELNSAEHEQATKLEAMKNKTSLGVAGIQASAGIQEAQIREKGAGERLTQEQEFGKARMSTLRRQANDPKASEEVRNSANAELADGYHAEVAKAVDARMASDVNMINASPEQKSASRAAMYVKEMSLKGIKMPMSVWRQTMPGASDAEIRGQAKKLGIQIAD